MGKHEVQEVLEKHRGQFHPVVPFNPANDRMINLDFTAANTELTDDILSDTGRFSYYINDKLRKNNARYGIGGYGEHRTVYRYSRVFDASSPGEEPRRLHLGLDIWGKPQTAVMAPLDGIVHSFDTHHDAGNYGSVVILSHQLDKVVFYTLYGHLGLNSIKNMQEGDRVEKGEIFADLGIPAENGHWPPHLHFQVIHDMQGFTGDYPGVCRYSEREKFLANCPDPDLVADLNRFVGY